MVLLLISKAELCYVKIYWKYKVFNQVHHFILENGYQMQTNQNKYLSIIAIRATQNQSFTGDKSSGSQVQF